MNFNHTETGSLYKDRSLTATGIMTAIVAVLLIIAYLQISSVIKKRSISRMEEGVRTVIEEVGTMFEHDSNILNAAAGIVSAADNFDIESTREIMCTVSPLLETMQVNLLLPDDRVVTADGSLADTSGMNVLSFAAEAPLGEHVTDRVESLSGVPILRHFVPIVKNGRTEGLLYGVTRLKDMPGKMNIDNIYNASARVFVIDADSGDFLVDTWHNRLGNINDYRFEETRGGIDWEAAMESVAALDTGYIVFRSPTDGRWHYLYFAPAGINRWAIAVAVPEEEAFSSLLAIRRIGCFVGIALIVTILLFYYWVSKNAKRATERAVEQAILSEKLKRAEAADRAKSVFLSNMSHDIRTPMNAIIGFTTLAQSNLDSRERVREYLKKILSSGNHLLSLINDILDMSRIESGKLNIEEKECSIPEIFCDIRNIVQSQMQSKQISFRMDAIDVSDEDIYCDKLHVNRVLLNLLSNAIKFTPSGGTVEFSVRQKPGVLAGYGRYEFRVKDNGIGMSEEFARRIFEPFERERTSTVSGIQGTGLGMAITKNIVDAMGGTVGLETKQGEGTVFAINLDFRLRTGEYKTGTVSELEGRRALVVDNSFTTCDSVTKMLWKIGMRPEWSLHGREAVLRVRQAGETEDGYAACIVGWNLSDPGGTETVRRIRSLAGADIPVIALCANDWTAFGEEAKEAGVTAFCSKPVFLSELRDTLTAAVNGEIREQISEQIRTREETAFTPAAEELKGKRILLAEDNELNREIAEELLSENGFLVDTAVDGTEAVQKVRDSEPGNYALVLMDIQMPLMNGYDAARAIRALKDPALASIPIVAMTANAFDEDRRRALESGMNAHVAKPVNIENLLKILTDLIGEAA